VPKQSLGTREERTMPDCLAVAGTATVVRKMPQIKINLYATLRAYAGGAASIEVDVEPGQTIRQVLDQAGVPPERTRIVFVDNRAADLDQPLHGGEQVGVFPAIGGG